MCLLATRKKRRACAPKREAPGELASVLLDARAKAFPDRMGSSNSTEPEPEEEETPVNVDTGDSVKVKQTLDEAAVKAVLDHGYEEHHTLDNIKLLLMLVACAFAMVAQFWPIPFPKSRPLLGICCSMYFCLSGILQLVVWFVERDAIMFTTTAMPIVEGAPPKPKRDGQPEIGLRIRSSFPRFQVNLQRER